MKINFNNSATINQVTEMIGLVYKKTIGFLSIEDKRNYSYLLDIIDNGGLKEYITIAINCRFDYDTIADHFKMIYLFEEEILNDYKTKNYVA